LNYRVPFYRATYPNRLKEINSDNFNKVVCNAVEEIESRFNKLIKAKYTLSVNNPSTAIHLSLCALDLKRGDKVICPINAYVDVPESIRHFDSEPIFVDIEPKSYHMNIESLKKALKDNSSKKLRAIIVSHFSGLQQDIKDIVALAKEYKVVIIEDFTDSSILGDRVEFLGDIALFSLNYKLDNTLKGAVLGFRDEKIYNRAKLVREHGLVLASRDVSYLYDIIEVGCDYRLDNLSAYLLDRLIEDRVELLKKKREIVDIYYRELDSLKHVTLPIKDDSHLYSYFIIEIDKNRDAFARELKSRGIEVGLHYIPLNFTTYYKNKYNLKVFSFPNALNAYQKILSIPCNGKMSIEDAEYVCKAIKEVDSIHI
jgi:dTDP-4-amino-4,6-dideoxygalactose transaminase